MQDKHDAAIDKTLAALGSASPPEGMEARIQQRLQYQAGENQAYASVWRPGKAWWSGTLAGAVAATLVCYLVLFSPRSRTSTPPHTIQAVASPRSDSTALPVSSVKLDSGAPCARSAVAHKPLPRSAPALMRAAAEPPKVAHRPTSEDSLTRQERELVRLAQIADPQDLSAMTSEARARADAQQTAAFQKFFTPPPPPPHDLGANE